MKRKAPLGAWILWGFGLLTCLTFLYGSGRQIYRQWVQYETGAGPMTNLRFAAAVLGLAGLIWLSLHFKRSFTRQHWILLGLLIFLQFALAILHFSLFWSAFEGTSFG